MWRIYGPLIVVSPPLEASGTGEMQKLQRQADALGLATHGVKDAGLTQVAAGSFTVLAIGGTESVLDTVTGALSLL